MTVTKLNASMQGHARQAEFLNDLADLRHRPQFADDKGIDTRQDFQAKQEAKMSPINSCSVFC